MSRHSNKYIALLLVTMTFCGCELDYAPENTLVDEKVYKTERTAEAALMGAYVRLNVFLSGAPQDQNNYANAGYTYLLADVGTNMIDVRSSSSTFQAIDTGEYSTNEHDGFLSSMWQWGYNAIDLTNNIIIGINKYGTYNAATRSRHIAEAKFIRAYIYMTLLQIYGDKALLGNDNGPGVIINAEPYSGYNPDNIKTRATNAQCWDIIINDLREAINDLSEEVPAAANRIRANKAAAKALLSRAYLYKGTYTDNQSELAEAASLARDVLATSGYVFANTSDEFANNLFPRNEYSQATGYPDPTSRSQELIFFEPSRISTTGYDNGLSYYRKTSYYVPDTVLSFYDADDVRCTYLIGTGSTSEYPGNKTTMKYAGGANDDVIYIRLSEVKLTLAEAVARTTGNITSEALAQLNDIHQRAYPVGSKPAPYTIADFADTDAFIKAILTERRRELAYEGHYRWDLMRTNNLLNDKKLGALPQARWNMPIPNYEINISYGVIKQNSGYAP